MYTIVEKAGAKINLHLDVLGKRTDGYHNIFSLMAGLELHDLIILEHYDLVSGGYSPEIIIENGGGAYCRILNDIDVNDNLITHAVKNYLKKAGLTGKLHFVVEKNIPHGAGLAGGSSDAAAALRAIDAVVEPGIDNILNQSAIETGSDVPFCLNGGLAIVEMKGERVVPVEEPLEGYVLLVNNGLIINTGYAYRLLEKEVVPGGISDSRREEFVSILRGGKEFWKDFFKNDFEEPLFREYPHLRDLKEDFYNCGASFAAMSGSGSTVFGIFDEENICMDAFRFFSDKNNRCFFSKFAAPAVL
jgi:4-diphosphocytidyl-2-C-methyl-D-erythritol kinase